LVVSNHPENKETALINLFSYLEKYAAIFAEKNRNPFIQIELGGHILKSIPLVNQGFINGLAEMVHNRRKHLFPSCDQHSDWFKAEGIFYSVFLGENAKMLAIKCVLLAAYCDCIEKKYDLPDIDGAMQALGVHDEKIIEALEGLNADQSRLLFQSACMATLDIAMVELFLRREITQFYLEQEGEIMQQFKIAC